jgi:hypothetical protein
MTTISSHTNAARGCRCASPFRGDDTCLLCGRRVPELMVPTPRAHRSPHDGNPWTPAGVVRALRTFEFFVGRPPSPTDWSFQDDTSWPSVRTVLRIFGSFDAAVGAARGVQGRSAA